MIQRTLLTSHPPEPSTKEKEGPRNQKPAPLPYLPLLSNQLIAQHSAFAVCYFYLLLLLFSVFVTCNCTLQMPSTFEASIGIHAFIS
ncbi:hypothetical protein M3223_18990 [Paenibacillus pasadenensis]|nr:hypothetical protein [Paenibacillus pasadenensis]